LITLVQRLVRVQLHAASGQLSRKRQMLQLRDNAA
jgi:hypothetical protein